jgi:RimJ/RimL family protein N-acetyltransferase
VSCVGYLCLLEIDWQKAVVGNMSFRVLPNKCGAGIGSAALEAVTECCLDWGFERLRLDVAASNARAPRCYEKCGFRISGEFFRDAHLDGVDVSEAKYDFLRPHLSLGDGRYNLRFYWMERTRS